MFEYSNRFNTEESKKRGMRLAIMKLSDNPKEPALKWLGYFTKYPTNYLVNYPGNQIFQGLLTVAALALALTNCSASTTRPLLALPCGINMVQRSLSPAAAPNHFTFVMGGDNRSTGRGVPMPPTATQIFRELHLLQPAFALWMGDTIYGSDDSVGEAEAEYDVFLQSVALGATPVFNAPGNHEIFNRRDLEQLYVKRMGPLYGSFDYGNSHFIAIDTEEIGPAGGVSVEQMTWLKQDMEANKGAAHLFAFMHHPLYPYDDKEMLADPPTVTALHKLFVTYGVKNVFQAHEHGFFKSVHDGITYWVSGGAGAPTSGSPEEGGYQHYVQMEVDGAQVTGTVLEPWRLFSTVGPSGPDGSATALVSNYDGVALSLCAEFTAAANPDAVAWATSTYKGKTKYLTATIVPSRVPGVVTVRCAVPAHRSVLISLGSKAGAAKAKTASAP